MKKVVFFIILIAAFSAASAQSQIYTVTGKIDGAEGVRFYLQKNVAGKVVNLDTAIIKDGVFVIKGGSVQYPESVLLTTADKKFRVSFYLENTDITIKGNLAYLGDAVITGSKTQDEMKELSASVGAVRDRYSSVIKEYEEAKKSGNEDVAKEKMKHLMEMSKEMQKVQKEFIISHPNSFAIPNLLRMLSSSMGGSELETIINSLSPEVAKTPVIIDLKLRVEILKRVDIGQKAPDFTQNDPAGKPIALSSLTGKNILLIDFWAAWCGPCRAENPNVVKVYNEFKDKGFDILGVSLDRTAAEWTKAIAEDKLSWTQVSDVQYWNNTVAKLYGVNSIPASFLLDKNGVIIAKNLRGEELHNKVKELVGK
jgi:peroxiredoxin